MTQARPFLKWAGGKTALLPELLKRVPKKYGTYFEPFVGAGALFFALQPTDALLNDVNTRLVNTYIGVRDYVANVNGLLNDYAARHCEDFYYEMRGLSSIDHLGFTGIAAWMIYMNKAGFNGLYRVNKKGGFNVPWGKHAKYMPDHVNLRACSQALKGFGIENMDFRKFVRTRANSERGDFVYFDPPYAPLSETSDFTSYTKDKFGPDDQRDLRDLALELKAAGVHVLLSNSAAPSIYKLYARGFKIEQVQARRNINSKGNGRGAITELLIS